MVWLCIAPFIGLLERPASGAHGRTAQRAAARLRAAEERRGGCGRYQEPAALHPPCETGVQVRVKAPVAERLIENVWPPVEVAVTVYVVAVEVTPAVVFTFCT